MDEQDKIDEIKNKAQRRINLLIGLVGLTGLCFLSVYLFTRSAPSFFPVFNIKSTGEIGDTIGGITSPIIGIASAFLIYWSFQAQNRANEIQFELLKSEGQNRKVERNFEITLTLFSHLKDDFLKLKISIGKDNQFKYGKSAIDNFTSKLNSLELATALNKNQKYESVQKHLALNIYSDFIFILHEYYIMITKIEVSEFNEREKLELYLLLRSFYRLNLKSTCKQLVDTYDEYNLNSNDRLLIKQINNCHKNIAEIVRAKNREGINTVE